MQSSLEEPGIIIAFLKNLERHSIPRALAVKKRVFEGELLKMMELPYITKLPNKR